MKADLHNHTTASDGILNIDALSKYAKNKNIEKKVKLVEEYFQKNLKIVLSK